MTGRGEQCLKVLKVGEILLPNKHPSRSLRHKVPQRRCAFAPTGNLMPAHGNALGIESNEHPGTQRGALRPWAVPNSVARWG